MNNYKSIWRLKLPAGVAVLIILLVIIIIWGWFFSNLVLKVARMAPGQDPSELGFKYQNLDIPCGKIILKSWFIKPANKTDKTIILAHGWGTNKSDILGSTIFLSKRGGYNLLYFDFRNHGQSGGSLTSLGRWEKDDIKAVVNYLKANESDYCKKIGLYGFSMGANASILAASELNEICGVAAESPFTYFDRTVARFAKIYYHIPRFPLVDLTLIFIKLRLGFDPQKYSSINYVSSIAPRPVLFIYGENDNRAPLNDGKLLFEKAREPKEIFIVPGAGHGEAYLKAGMEYENVMLKFFKKVFKEN
jgi:uncharacterized protein